MNRIYFDHNATTPCDEDVLKEMLPYFCQNFGNNSSLHSFGRDSQKAVDAARDRVAKALGCSPNEVYFTSGGTESDNWALRGAALASRHKGNHIITTKTEHHAILNCAKQLEKEGFEVTYLDVDKNGFVSLEDFKNNIKDSTTVVSIIFANNETGAIQPISEIGKICKERGIIFHTDAVAAIGSQNFKIDQLNVHLLSLSAHKFYGPKGIGVLYVKNGQKIKRLVWGGAQERNMRGGTTSTPLVVGLAAAIEKAFDNVDAYNSHCLKLKTHLFNRLKNEFDNIKFNSGFDNCLNNNLNVSFQFVEGESLLLMMDLNGIALSSGSACTSGSLEPSHVLLAMGVEIGLAHGSLRFSFGKENTIEEVDFAVDKLKEILKKLRELSPLTE